MRRQTASGYECQHASGAERPGAMAVAVDAPMGDRLVVEIDNGDDPPLPVTGVTVLRPRFELVAVLPEADPCA